MSEPTTTLKGPSVKDAAVAAGVLLVGTYAVMHGLNRQASVGATRLTITAMELCESNAFPYGARTRCSAWSASICKNVKLNFLMI